MYLIVHTDGVVMATCSVLDGTTLDNVAFVDSIPEFESKKNHVGQLMYDGENIYWGYDEIESGISDEEFVSMLEEVL